MRKNLLSLSIAAMIGGLGFAGVASAGVSIVGANAAGTTIPGAVAGATTATALTLSPGGVGNILVVPYFSTQNGNDTLLNIVNTDEVNGKAVKVRFRGAANSDDVFDFQVYLSPGDVWTGAVSQAASGKSKMVTSDNSCTLPGRAAINTEFITDRLPPTFTDVQKAEWTREGYVEIFTMADIPPLPAGTTAALSAASLYTAIKHVNGIAPGCPAGEPVAAALQSLSADPATEVAAVNLGFAVPTTGLMGASTIINVAGASVAWSSNATALEATLGGVAAPGRIVFSPQTSDAVTGFPTAALPTTNVPGPGLGLTNDPVLRNGSVVGRNFDLPDLSTPYVGTTVLSIFPSTDASGSATQIVAPSIQANAVATSLAVKTISNEYLTNPVLAAATDWTFTFPTRRYAVAVSYPALSTGAFALVYPTSPILPAVVAAPTASNSFTAANVTLSGNLACVSTGAVSSATSPLSYWGRDEQQPTTVVTGFVISPGTFAPTATFSFCGEASVFNFGGAAPSRVLGANVAVTSRAPFVADGWLKIQTPGLAAAGLPLIGASYMKATGPAIAGKSTNFGVTLEHRFTK